MIRTIFFAFVFLSICCSCDEDVVPPSPNCELTPEVGPCDAAFERYYFDPIEGRCKVFIWGGCAGVVPFETLADCESSDCGN